MRSTMYIKWVMSHKNLYTFQPVYNIWNSHPIHSEKKRYQNSTPGVLLLQMVRFFHRGTLFSLIIMFMEKGVPPGHWGTKIVPRRVPYYGQSNSAPRGTVPVPFFLNLYVTPLSAIVRLSDQAVARTIFFFNPFEHLNNLNGPLDNGYIMTHLRWSWPMQVCTKLVAMLLKNLFLVY